MKKIITFVSAIIVVALLIFSAKEVRYLYLKHELIKKFRSTPEADRFFREHADNAWRVVKTPDRTYMFWNFLNKSDKPRDFFIEHWDAVLDELDLDPYLAKFALMASKDSRSIDFWLENFDALVKFHHKYPKFSRGAVIRPDFWFYMTAEHPEKGRAVLHSADPANDLRKFYEEYVIKKHLKIHIK